MDKDAAQRLLTAWHRMMSRYDPPLSDYVSQCARERSSADGHPPRPDAVVTQRFAICPDPQYPRLSDTKVAETGAEKNQAKAKLDAYYRDIKAYQSTFGGAAQVPVFINGDIVERGDPERLDVAYGLIGQYLARPAYMGLGNHDCDLKDDFLLDETKMVRSCYRHVTYMKAAGVTMDLRESGSSDPFWQMYEGSLSYVVDIGDIRHIQMNYFPWFTRNLKALLPDRDETKEFKLYSSMQWLEARLKEVASTSKVVIAHMHYLPFARRSATGFFDLCAKYEVPAVFHGHNHGLRSEKHLGTTIYECGAGFYRTFAVAEYQKAEGHLAVYYVRDGVVDRSVDAGVAVQRPIPVPETGRITRDASRCTVELRDRWAHAEFVEATFVLNGNELGVMRYRPNEVVRLETIKPADSVKVKLRYINYRTRGGDWTAWVDAPAYGGELPGVPAGLRVDVRGPGFSACTVHWDAVADAHGYVVKVALGANSLGGNVLTSLPPNCHERTDVSMAALKSPPATYRGMYIKVMTTTHSNVWSEPGLLLIDDLIDQLEGAAPAQDAEALELETEQLVAEREALMDRLVAIETRLQEVSG